MFLTWGSFFSQPDALDPQGLQKFDQFLALAEAAGLYVHPTGPDHWEGVPAWLGHDTLATTAPTRGGWCIERFWTQLAGRYRGRPVIFAYDLRNEPSVPWDTPAMRTKWNRWLQSRYGTAEKLAAAWGVPAENLRWGAEPPPPPQPPPPPKAPPGKPDSPTARPPQNPPAEPPATDVHARQVRDYQLFREEIADQWTQRQVAAIKAADAQALVTVGMIQWSVPALLPGLQHYAAFRPQRQAPLLDFLEIHFYPLANGFYEYAAEDEVA